MSRSEAAHRSAGYLIDGSGQVAWRRLERKGWRTVLSCALGVLLKQGPLWGRTPLIFGPPAAVPFLGGTTWVLQACTQPVPALVSTQNEPLCSQDATASGLSVIREGMWMQTAQE